ncbi:hypothetical protein [Streptomyces californicus]|uniref:hypothetical protein n=1 Tax=Streptomyces californicus TaxID=67351 RepID=UPI0037128CC1
MPERLQMPFTGFDEISTTITGYLTAAGWKPTKRCIESEVPEFTFNNGNMQITAFQYISERSLALTLVDLESGDYSRAEVQYVEAIDHLLGALAAWSDHVTRENFGLMLQAIAREVPEVLLAPLEGGVDTPWERVLPRT